MTRQNVTVFRTGFLGDTVCAIPAFRLIRQHYPEANLALMCDRAVTSAMQAADIVASLEIFDRVVEYPTHSGNALLEIARALDALEPDVIIMLNQRNEAAQQTWRRRLFFRLRRVPTVLSLPSMHRSTVVINEPTRLVHGLNRLGIRGSKPAYGIGVDESARETIYAELQRAGVDGGAPYIIFCGGGKARTQRWPLSRYAEVLADIGRHLDLPVIGIGNAAELDAYREHVLPHVPQLRLLSASLSFRQLCELSRSALAYFGNDTGPMHVAAAVGCPTVVVMSGRNTLGAWDPDVHPALVLRRPVPCQGCFLNDCTHRAHQCMMDITPARVTGDVRGFLQRLLRNPARAYAANL